MWINITALIASPFALLSGLAEAIQQKTPPKRG
jgi:hypothetical protein